MNVKMDPAGAHPPQAPVAGRVLLFATLGYLYIAVVMVAVGAAAVLMALAGAGGLVVLPAWLLLVIVLSLWVKIADPEGKPLRREEAPRLFRAIDRARAQLRAPEVDVVLLGAAANAGVLERPRFGVFGPRVRYLEVGLPLLHAMSEPEVRAILAHEFAHLSRQHNRGHLWLVRAATTWHRLVTGLQALNHWGRFLFLPFFRWYTPRLEVLTQAASRAHEYESDRLAARAVGARVMGRALLRLAVSTVMLDRQVMRGILRASADHAAPPPDAFAALLRGAQARPDPAALDQALRSVVHDRSLEVHSHPSLCERLESLGLSTDPASLLAEFETDEPPAVDALLDPALVAAATEELGAAWSMAAAAGWEALHTDARVWREAGLDDGGAQNAGRAALLAHARWAFHCQPPDQSIPLLRRALEHGPDEPEPAALLGRLLVEEDDAAARAEGVALLEREAARPSVHAPGAVEALQAHYARVGAAAALHRLRARELALRDEVLRGLHDRHRLLHNDTFRPYPLPPAAREALLRALEEQPAVKQAFLVEKQTRLLADSPVVVLAVHLHVPFYRYSSGSLATRVCEALLPHVHLPETRDYLVAAVEGRSRLLRRLRRMPGAEVYRRGEAVPEPLAPGEWAAPGAGPRRRTAAGAFLAAVLVGGAVYAVTGEDEGRDERRLAKLRRAAREAPATARAHRRLAEELVRQDRWAEAEGPLERAAALEPGNVWLHNALGWARIQKGEYAQALAPLRRAVALEPEHPYAVHNLGWALFNAGSLDEAERVYRTVVRIRPDLPRARGELAEVLVAMGRLGEAETEFSRALRQDPDDAWLLHGLAIAQMRQGRMAYAEGNLRRAAALAPRNALIWADLGHLEHLNGDYAQSAAAFQRAHELDPTYFANQPYRAGMWEASRAGRMIDR
ncbi:MAG: tetratricopeptide repeat protein [Gemmatimonadetes bacterium]|nr:tetratricopeptide repeat protein [Gemmatimonadota bacterium]